MNGLISNNIEPVIGIHSFSELIQDCGVKKNENKCFPNEKIIYFPKFWSKHAKVLFIPFSCNNEVKMY